jgi:hypothetical protein
MEIARQGIKSNHDKDKALEAQISLNKGWWRAKDKSEMRARYQHMVDLLAKRSPQQIRKLELKKFGYYL